MGAEPVRSSGGAHTYCGGRDAATAVGLEMTAGASALGRRGHVQEDISSDAPAIAKSQLLAESAYRGDARGAARKPIGRKQASGEGGSAPWRQRGCLNLGEVLAKTRGRLESIEGGGAGTPR